VIGFASQRRNQPLLHIAYPNLLGTTGSVVVAKDLDRTCINHILCLQGDHVTKTRNNWNLLGNMLCVGI
jgi:hypothetical protein